MKKTIYIFITVSFLTTAANNTAGAQPGTLDSSFGNAGIVLTDFAASSDDGRVVIVQADGKIIMGGTTYSGPDVDFALTRYNSNGTLDITFGAGGKVITPVGNTDDYGNSIAIQSDGKIVFCGYSWNGSDRNFALVRYNTNGALDNSFGTGGIVTTDFGNFTDDGRAVMIQSDGKIVVAGSSDYDFALARYKTNGTLDSTFSSDGKVTTDFGFSTDDFGRFVLQQPDGKIIVAGYSNLTFANDFALARYDSAGALDLSFGYGGKMLTDFGGFEDFAWSIALQADGKIVAGGYANSNGTDDDFALVRYKTDGLPDSTFGVNGKVTTAVDSANDTGFKVMIQGDGKILLAGYINDIGFSNIDFALVRYLSDGSLDTSFGTGGKVATEVGSAFDFCYSAYLQSDGKIILAGSSNDDFALVRYKGVADTLVSNITDVSCQSIIHISPNPFSSGFKINCNQMGEVVLYDVTGMEILRQQIMANTTFIHAEKIPEGIYFLSYNNGVSVKNFKLVKGGGQ